MPVYLVAAAQVADRVEYEEYVRKAAPTFAGVDVKVLALSDEPVLLEGSTSPNRVAVMEFPDMAKVEAWYNNEAYQSEAVPLRHAASTTNFIVLIQGNET